MIKKITLTNCEPATKKDGSFVEGIGQGGKSWKLYDCRDLSTKYSSFTDFTDKVGVPTDFEVERKPGKPSPKGGNYPDSYTISLPKGGGKGGNNDALFEMVLTKVNKIEKMVEEIHGLITAEDFVKEDLPSLDKTEFPPKKNIPL